LVAIGAKRIETRSWPLHYRGPLAIHAAKAMPGYALDAVARFGDVLWRAGYKAPSALPLGAVLCLTSVRECEPAEDLVADLEDFERQAGNYTPGRYGIVLGPVVRCFQPPIPARGSLGLWDWDPPAGVLGPPPGQMGLGL